MLQFNSRHFLTNASWASRFDTQAWYLNSGLAVPLVLAAQRIKIQFRQSECNEHLYTPADELWFLPQKLDQEDWRLPCQNVMVWWLELTGIESPEHLEQLFGEDENVTANTLRSWLTSKTTPELSNIDLFRKHNFGLGSKSLPLINSFILWMVVARSISNLHNLALKCIGSNELEAFYQNYKKGVKSAFDCFG